MARLFADEHFPSETVMVLRGLGHDVLTLREIGLANKGFADDKILALASANGRAVLTQNRRDFFREHKKWPGHHGIIACTKNLNYKELADCIHRELIARQDLRSQVVRVYRPNKVLSAEQQKPEQEKEKVLSRQRRKLRTRSRRPRGYTKERGGHEHER